MRLLAGLSILQILAILYLAHKIVILDPEANDATVTRQTGPVIESTDAIHSPVESIAVQPYPDEGQFRKIVREELAAQLDLLYMPDRAATPDDDTDPVLESQRRYQRDLVEQELEHYISQGAISDAEMQGLETEIAKLDKEGQREMLGRLIEAMNSGELEGRL